MKKKNQEAVKEVPVTPQQRRQLRAEFGEEMLCWVNERRNDIRDRTNFGIQGIERLWKDDEGNKNHMIECEAIAGLYETLGIYKALNAMGVINSEEFYNLMETAHKIYLPINIWKEAVEQYKEGKINSYSWQVNS